MSIQPSSDVNDIFVRQQQVSTKGGIFVCLILAFTCIFFGYLRYSLTSPETFDGSNSIAGHPESPHSSSQAQ